MTNISYQNEQAKRDFFTHLRGAEGFTESSVSNFAGAIHQWQVFSENEDFNSFNKDKALAFRKWLETKEAKNESGQLSLGSRYNYLRRVRKFFEWLSRQPDYKKVLKNEVRFLRLSKKDARVAQQGTRKKMPTLEEVKKIIEGIKANNELDMRDRALICFALITGARISAIVSLKMKHFDKGKKLIDQNPKEGVKTKGSKRILTTFFPIGWDEPQEYFMKWFEHLERKGFKGDDPIFPATANLSKGNKFAFSKDSVSNRPWQGTASAREIFKKRCLNAGVDYYHPHCFRHLLVNLISKIRLTEEEKRAVSLNLGHANVGTTFGSYGYGSMDEEDAVEIVKKMDDYLDRMNKGDCEAVPMTKEEKEIIEKVLKRF